ncbi:ARV1-like protein [Teratosphaeria nubilosa]|uniref:Protein ARV n=1 Tax=Teratosphaeria nubilosa TaxID=161662 RepID=A0A6G1LQ70_9PEZI|nr:ARV1-like protein [Teratosphaeria nubilosa]
MPICIECRYPVSQLYTTYSKADDKALGKGVRLTQCPRCKKFADKYVEHDYVVLFLDLVLIRPQVYRHLLFNNLGREDGTKFDPSIVRFGVLLLLFDVYLTWARIEKATPSSSPTLPLSPPPPLPPFPSGSNSLTNGTAAALGTNANYRSSGDGGLGGEGSWLATQPILLQYLFFLALCALESFSFHLPIRTLLSLELPSWIHTLIPYYPHPALVSTAILVSSFTKLFPLLLLVWQYDLPSSASAVSWAVIINNVAALEILLDCGYIRAGLLCAVGAVCRAGVGWGILRAVGVGGGVAAAGVVETGDLIEVWRRAMDGIGLG